ncbi:ABC transporter substrate-binding protein [Streptomyces microflavus]|uniref:ABC transporter substrate-binding protein n=1 Tax=Streptomyces microflavus TaxID=1919 RepID=UPI0029BBF3C4|nr:ABC transporter substrate-binding protein [Streptomyces microflavus]MDX2406767.1 ABC transporter substrate-binding protein [Streptomyces microflavus]
MRWAEGRTAAASASAAVLVLLATGCARQTAAGGGECQGKTVSVGVTRSASDAPLYVAQDKGYFAGQGLKVRFLPFDSAAKMIAPLGAGQLDVGAGAPSAGFYNAVAREVKLRIVADKGSMPKDHGYMPLMVRKDLYDSGRVRTISDLKGLKFAEPAQATATSNTAAVMLKSGGLAYGDVKHEFLGFSEHVTAYGNKAVDAGLTTEPSASIAEKRGVAVRLATPPDFYPNQQLAVVLYGGGFAAEDSKAGVCFMTAYLQGARDYVSAMSGGKVTGRGSDDIVRIVTKATGLDPELYRSLVANYVHPDGRVDVTSLRRDHDFFEEQGWMEGKASVDDLVDPSFAEAAVKKLGPHDTSAS